jgi:hypothetical protein
VSANATSRYSSPAASVTNIARENTLLHTCAKQTDLDELIGNEVRDFMRASSVWRSAICTSTVPQN